MALIQLDYYSTALKMSTLVNIVIPDQVRIEDTPLSSRKTLWLLHGLSDDGSSPLRLSKIELYAQDTGLVVVMPSVGRSFYFDDINGQDYGKLITDELPDYLHLVLGLSKACAQNAIAGISMGGYGAARIALTHPKRYNRVGLLSGVLDTSLRAKDISDSRRHEFPFLYSNAAKLKKAPLNPLSLLADAKDQGLKLHIFCGLDDGLLPMSQNFADKAKSLGYSVDATFAAGNHEWRFWDRCLDTFTQEL